MQLRPNGDTIGGGRRVITILFCDVRGSTAVAGRLDPEEWAEIMNGAFERIMQPIYRYEGTVVRLLGDAILAFFGAPIAREDDPQRAVLAGLEIQEEVRAYADSVKSEWGVNFSVRCGINTGLVVVGAFGSGQHSEYTAMGDAVNLAARMEQTAQPGSVQIAEPTYRIIAPLFEVEDLGKIKVKGKDEPVRAYRVLRRRAEPGALRGIPGVETPMVGRGVEFAILVNALERLQQGHGGVVFLEGEAGLGKSRLMRDLEQYSRQTYPDTRWFRTGSFSYERSQPYGQVQRILRHACDIAGDDPPAIQRQKIADRLAGLSLAEPEQTRRALEVLFGVSSDTDESPPLEGETFRGSLYATMTPFWQALTNLHPIVAVFDDMQWMDDASAALLKNVLGDVGMISTLLLCAMRPGSESAGEDLMQVAEKHFPENVRHISLRPLTFSENELLVNSLLPEDETPAALRREILVKSAGNPLFVEEVVRVLRDRDGSTQGASSSLSSMSYNADALEVPDNLQTLLTARVDHLQQDVRETLLLASVLGPVINFRALTHISDRDEETLLEHLQELEAQDLVKASKRSPELEYRFVHILLQETAYRMLLRRQRRQYHLSVAEAFEQMYTDSLEEHAVVLAHHFDKAGSSDRASDYYGRAGSAALRLYSLKEAVSHFTRALDLVKEQAPDHITAKCSQLFLDKGRALELDGQFDAALENYREMEEVARSYEDRRLELASVVARLPLFAVPTPLFDPELVREQGEAALQLAQELGDEAAEARLLWSLSNANAMANRLETATEYGERALEVATKLDLRDLMARTLTDLGVFCYGVGGALEKSKAALKRASEICRELNDLPMLSDDLASLALISVHAGDFKEALEYSTEAQKISESINNLWGQSYSRYKTGVVFWEWGDPDQAIETITTCLELGQQAGFLASQVEPRVDLASIYKHLGDADRAAKELEQALHVPRTRHLPDLAYVIAMQAQLRLISDDHAGAEELLAKYREDYASATWPAYQGPFLVAEADLALSCRNYQRAADVSADLVELLRGYGIHSYLPRGLYLRGCALTGLGNLAEARAALQESYTWANKLGSRWMTWQIAAALIDLEEDVERADELRGHARESLNYIVQHIDDETLRSTFLAQSAVAAMLSEVDAPADVGRDG